MDDAAPHLQESSSADSTGMHTAGHSTQLLGIQPLIDSSRSVRWLELIALFLLVILADFTLYDTHGYAGPALFLAIAPLLLILGAVCHAWSRQTCIALFLTYAAAARLLWCGNWLAMTFGFLMLGCVSFSLAGGALYVLDLCRFLGGLFLSSACGLLVYERWARLILRRWIRIPAMARVLQYALPPVAGLVFFVIFVLANPDLASWMTTEISALIQRVDQWLFRLVDSPWRIVFWCLTAWISVGLLRPLLVVLPVRQADERFVDPTPVENEFYPAYRNTFAMLIGLFAAYLGFEFWTMWAGTFPPNFYYAGYAHEGAFWLTVALGLATLLLSAVFRGRMWRDARLPFLRNLAMVWSLENLLLAAAVYHRLFIYIDFNGMTRMRVVGLLGTSTVVTGFILVVIKIWQKRNFAWVIRHQLVALALAIYLYAVLPVDAYVMNYDVRQIMSGNLKPSVQIAHHETSLEGKLMLFPLLQCEDEVIRHGIAEMLLQTEAELQNNSGTGWKAYQGAAVKFRQAAQDQQAQLHRETGPPGAWERFHAYSFQWY